MTWFSSPVWAQGLRRDKEYARLGDNLRHCSWKWTTSWYAWYRWLPAAWLGLNEALPKCRTGNARLTSTKSTCEIDPSRTSTALLLSFFSHGSSCERSINSGDLPMIVLGYVDKATCFTDRNGHQKQNCESLKRMWRNFAHLTRPPYQSNAWRPTGMHCWKVTRHKRITCIFFLDVVRTLVFLRTYKSAQMVEVLLLNRFLRSMCQTAKG